MKQTRTIDSAINHGTRLAIHRQLVRLGVAERIVVADVINLNVYLLYRSRAYGLRAGQASIILENLTPPATPEQVWDALEPALVG